jgi:hypothetical protein
VGVAGEYDNEEGAANSDGRAPRVGPEVAFGEGVYAGGGSFMPGLEGFVRGRELLLRASSSPRLAC